MTPNKIPNFSLAILNPTRLFYQNTRCDIYYIDVGSFFRMDTGFQLSAFVPSSPFEIQLCRENARYLCRDTPSSNVADGKTLFHLYGWNLYAGSIVASWEMFLLIFRLLRAYLPIYASKSPQGYSRSIFDKEKKMTVLWRNRLSQRNN